MRNSILEKKQQKNERDVLLEVSIRLILFGFIIIIIISLTNFQSES